jgi:diguanylate cyclase (GGDEF)-like protein
MECDLNGFKKINDSHGHLAGDKVLKLFANMMREVCREYDYAARMGGDEFVLVAPNMTPGSVGDRTVMLNSLAQRAGRAICGENILSLSLGVAYYPKDGADTEQLLAEADKRMYAAKRRHYGSLPSLPPQNLPLSPLL